MLGRVEASEKGAATGGTHGAVAKGARKGEAVIGQAFAVGQIGVHPSIGPMLWLAFLVGKDDDDIGTGGQRGAAAGKSRLWFALASCQNARG